MWSGLWQKHARYRETNVAIAYEQQGFFEQAQGAYEVAMSKVHNDYCSSPAPGSVRSELRLWEEHWIRQVFCTLLNYEVVMSILSLHTGNCSIYWNARLSSFFKLGA